MRAPATSGRHLRHTLPGREVRVEEVVLLLLVIVDCYLPSLLLTFSMSEEIDPTDL